jgi:hypothetical protein
MTRFLLTLLALCGLGVAASAAESPITAITAYPEKLTLVGTDDAPQLIITGKRADGREVDLTAAATYSVSSANVAKVEANGRVFPVANGKAEITVSYEGKTVKVPVVSEKMEAPLPLNYPNQVNPIFTKLSCSSGGCHGKIAGQNGFRLSLLGFDPAFDYDNLLKEARGRRVFPAAPEKSLLLTKATGLAPHGGGKKMDPNGEEFKIVRRWIASGMPYGSPNDPTVTKISVYPATRGLRPLLRRHGGGHHPPRPVREQRHRHRHRERIGRCERSQHHRPGRDHGPLQRERDRLPRHRPPRGRVGEVRIQGTDRRRQVHGEEVAGAEHHAVGTLLGRGVHSPRVARPHRHAARPEGHHRLRRGQGPAEAREAR